MALFLILVFLIALSYDSRTLVAQQMKNEVSLAEEFFELMADFNSLELAERDAAEERLLRRFAEFEPVWMCRRFLTSGEISAEACERFQIVEARWRRQTFEKVKSAFSMEWSLDREAMRGKTSIRWREPCRVVYLVPALDAFQWGSEPVALRSVTAYSSPEIAPRYDESCVDIETTLEETEIVSNDNRGKFDALVGLDPREIELPVQVEEGVTETLRVGELTLSGAAALQLEKGGWRISLRLRYDQAFDAFDSHRVWLDKNDFNLKMLNGELIAPVKMRLQARNPHGADVVLEFADDVELDVAIVAGGARLSCRLPRFFARITVAR